MCFTDALSLPCCQYVCIAAVAYAAYVTYRFVTADADLAVLSKAPKSVAGKVVVVTGASSGIGEELAQKLNKGGAYVVLLARRREELDRVHRSLPHPEKAAVLVLDVAAVATHAKAVAGILALIRTQWDKEGVDILVNNAGRSQRSLVEESLDDLEVERTLMEVNFFGLVSITKQVLQQSMLRRHTGRIVNITSVAGKVAAPCSAAYSASKHAVQGWSDTLRCEVKTQGVTVLNVCPGPVRTNIEAASVRGAAAGKQEGADRSAGKMPVSRACDVIMAAMTNTEVTETWVSAHPVLCFVYMLIYLPKLAAVLGDGPIQKRIDAYRNGTSLYGSTFFESLKASFTGSKSKRE